MADLSDEDCLTISRFPLEPTIGHLREPLLAAIEQNDTDSQKPEVFSDDEQETGKEPEETGPEDTVSSLLLALAGHRVARKLRSKNSGGTVVGELATLLNRLDSNRIGIKLFKDLIEAVARKTTDVEIWKEVLRVIATTSRLTPPPSTQGTEVSFGGTPRSTNSASHQGSEQTKRLLEDALRDELWNCSYVKVPGFFEKYFDNKSWTEKGKQIYDSVKDTHSDGRWTAFPSDLIESAVWSWWTQFQDEHLANSRGIYYTTKSKKEMAGIDSEGQLDMLVKSRNAPVTDPHDWGDVCAIGEHTISKQGGQKFLQLARYARNIFSAQPRRRFVHGFILYNTRLELHVFDRSGTFSAEPFDIHEEPERFIRVITAYCMMSDEELGLDTFINREDDKEFVTFVDDLTGKDTKLQLESRPIARQAAIIGRGTSCFRTTDQKHAVKFSWVSLTRSPTEPGLLRLARKRNVVGIPILIGHRQIITTGELRSPLVFSNKRQLQSRHKRSEASFSNRLASTLLSENNADGREGRKRKSTEPYCDNGLKKSRSNSRTSRLSQVFEASDSFNDSQTSFMSQRSGETLVDRVLSCQVTRPAGRPLAKFDCVLELLRALRDATKVHRSLFLDGKILHRDISESNMIITDPDENDGFSGMLIDLELGTVVEDGKNTRTQGKRMTGTLKFMAIEVVELALRDSRRDLEHTYRHDLESLFYVFLSMCINHGWDKEHGAKFDRLQHWYIGSYEDIVRAKLGDMGPGFEDLILKKFSPTFSCLKDLATSLRDSLFEKGAKLRRGTPADPPIVLYTKLIDAFDKTIESLGD